uniref:Secreted protein n=1 Tax=Angiostrongylus cantonensis TaxID=6313 RepID=A0A0K0DFA2_ANGCA
MRFCIWVAAAFVTMVYCQYDIEDGYLGSDIYHQNGLGYVYGPVYGGMAPFYGDGLAGFGYQEPTPSGYRQPPPPLPYGYPPLLPSVDFHQLIPPVCNLPNNL